MPKKNLPGHWNSIRSSSVDRDDVRLALQARRRDVDDSQRRSDGGGGGLYAGS
jgi:hypothetical protein